MATDNRFILSAPLDQYFVDKDSGLPLANGTLTFWRDSARNEPKPVFQLSGSPPNYTYAPLPNPITLSASGTIVNATEDDEALYLFPYDSQGNEDLYFIDCRSSGGVRQWTREAWPNSSKSGGSIQPTAASDVTNQLSNPQFRDTFLNQLGVTTYTFSGARNEVAALAPSWDLVVIGTGTVTIKRIEIPGIDKVANNPPYALEIFAQVGITTCAIRQRMRKNSGLWSSTSARKVFLSGKVTAVNATSPNAAIRMVYNTSNAAPEVTILSEIISNLGFTQLSGTTATEIPPSTDANEGDDGYVDISVVIPPANTVRITNLQVVPTSSISDGLLLDYDLNSSNKNLALNGDYYIEALRNETRESALIGWHFPTNPRQFGAGPYVVTSTPAYVMDQTICQSSGGNFTLEYPSSEGKILNVFPSSANSSIMFLQYIEAADVTQLVSYALSMAVRCGIGLDKRITIRAYLFFNNSGGGVPTLPSTIGTLSSSGEFTLTNGSWAPLARNGLPQPAVGSVPTSAGTAETVGFSGWDGRALDDAALVFGEAAAVVTFAFEDANGFGLESISLTKGENPAPPNPKPISLVTLECQRFYQKSYERFTVPGSVTLVDSETRSSSLSRITVGVASVAVTGEDFSVSYTQKRATPLVRMYNPSTGAIDSQRIYARTKMNLLGIQVSSVDRAGDFSIFGTSGAISPANFEQTVALPNTVMDVGVFSAWTNFHWVADARMGIV